ncbi:MAG TPA: carboxyl transferase domain-containing protein, partial [Solirubrobacteraceae bacterium]|nr:carboxyl transferase domain-containing protein [Solirubrobacteraceae bacterium]
GAYIPAFCDIVIMREGNASMYLGSPRMAQMVIGEDVTLEQMGGAKMHTGVSGCAHQLVDSDEQGIELARRYLSYMPENWESRPPRSHPSERHPLESHPLESHRPESHPPRSSPPPAPLAPPPARPPAAASSERSSSSATHARARARARGPSIGDLSIGDLIPADENKPFDMLELIHALIDADSLLEIHPRWARELIVAYARLEGEVIGIVANQPKHKGGVLFSDSADKAARFIWTCNAFNIPLLFLADVPGFMIGTQVEREGIIRHGAKMISAVSQATVPKISVIVRKAYGAGLYAMAGPAFEPDACIALPSASIAVMGPQAAINAVYYNQLQAIADDAERAAKTEELRAQYAQDIDILHLASELVIDAVIEPERLRDELIKRFGHARAKRREWPARRNPVTPV